MKRASFLSLVLAVALGPAAGSALAEGETNLDAQTAQRRAEWLYSRRFD